MAHAVDSPGACVTRRFYKSGISEHFQNLQKHYVFYSRVLPSKLSREKRKPKKIDMKKCNTYKGKGIKKMTIPLPALFCWQKPNEASRKYRTILSYMIFLSYNVHVYLVLICLPIDPSRSEICINPYSTHQFHSPSPPPQSSIGLSSKLTPTFCSTAGADAGDFGPGASPILPTLSLLPAATISKFLLILATFP